MTTLSEDSASVRGAGADPVERVAAALRSHNIEAIVVDSGADARAYENARVREQMGVDTILAKVLIIYKEWMPGRTTVVLVREPVGI